MRQVSERLFGRARGTARRAPLTLLLAALLGGSVLAASTPAQGHERSPTLIELAHAGDSLEIRLHRSLALWRDAARGDHDAPRDTAVDLSDAALLGQLALRANGSMPLVLRFAPAEDDDDGDAIVRLRADLPPDATSISLAAARAFGAAIVRLDDGSDEPLTRFVAAGTRGETFPLAASAPPSFAALLEAMRGGFLHVLPGGLDHVLFVIAMFLLAPRLAPVLAQVTAFTVAHSLTLTLAMLGAIEPPAGIVEPLIALSIVLLSVENVVVRRVRHRRTALVFAFGLLHGLGFAGALGESGVRPELLWRTVLAFNFGIELGQLLVVLACFALAGWPFGGRPWYRRVIALPASLSIGGVGLLWLVQRTAL